MFGSLFRTKVTETSDAAERNRIQELFCEHGIDYVVKCKDIHQRNAVDVAKMGQAATPKFVYYFWVKKEQVGEAMQFLRG